MLQYHINWAKFGIGLFAATILSLSVHTVMLQGMDIAFPDLSVIDVPYQFIVRFCAALGLIIFWDLVREKLDGSFWKKWVLLFLIDAMLTESLFRSAFMDGYCTNSIGYMLINNVPKLLTIVVMCGLVVWCVPRLDKIHLKVVAAIVIAAIFMFVASPLTSAAWKPVMEAINHLAPKGEWCKLPYDANVLIPAYITFMEPVLACAVMAFLVWDKLAKNRGLRYLIFTLLILAIKFQLLMPIFYGVFGKGTFSVNLISEGQFALEAIVLSLSVGVALEWSTKSPQISN